MTIDEWEQELEVMLDLSTLDAVGRIERKLTHLIRQQHHMEERFMGTLTEARDQVLAAIADAKTTMERTEAAILSAITDLQGGTDAQAVADSLSAAATDLSTAKDALGASADSLTAADPTPGV